MNSKIISKTKSTSVIKLLLVACVIATSGAVTVLHYYSIILPGCTFFALFTWLCFGNVSSLDARQLLILFAGITCMFVSYAITSTSNSNINNYLALSLAMCLVFFVAQSMTFQDFQRHFCTLIVGLSVFGLIVFFAAWMGRLGGADFFDGYYMFGPFNLSKISEGRNSCIFWEPGAYQLFLNLSLLFLLKRYKTNKTDVIKLELLIITISVLSTKSTTGYLIFACVLLLCGSSIVKDQPRRVRVLVALLWVAFVIVSVTGFATSEVVLGKFQEGNVSYNIRSADISGSLELLANGVPLFGFGAESSSMTHAYSSLEIVNNSFGIFVLLANYGWVFFLGYFSVQMFTLCRRFNSVYFAAALIVILISQSTEYFAAYPMMLVFCFTFLGEKKRCIQRCTTRHLAKLEIQF